jgi:uncharacterized protein
MGAAARIVIGLVRVYQMVVRPLLPPVCRFEPSCSEYYRQALGTVGFWKATRIAAVRLSRCHPWHPGGYDPPPPAQVTSGDERAG